MQISRFSQFSTVGFYFKQATALLLLGLILIGFALPVFAADAPIFGSVRTSGPAWVDMGTGTWSAIDSERPLIAGDSLKTGNGGYAVLDLGDKGALGMYKDTQIAAAGHGKAAYIDVLGGKLAFHMARHSDITIAAADAEMFALSDPGARGVDGYVEFTESGETIVGVEEGVLGIIVAGVEKTIEAGQRYSLTKAARDAMNAEPEYYGDAPVQLAANVSDDKAAQMAAKRAREAKQAAAAEARRAAEAKAAEQARLAAQRAEQDAAAKQAAQKAAQDAADAERAAKIAAARRLAHQQAEAYDKAAMLEEAEAMAASATAEQQASMQMAAAKDSRRKPSTAGQGVADDLTKKRRLDFENEVAAMEDEEEYAGAVLIAGVEAAPVVVGSVGFIAAAVAITSFEGDTDENGSP